MGRTNSALACPVRAPLPDSNIGSEPLLPLENSRAKVDLSVVLGLAYINWFLSRASGDPGYPGGDSQFSFPLLRRAEIRQKSANCYGIAFRIGLQDTCGSSRVDPHAWGRCRYRIGQAGLESGASICDLRRV